VLDKKSDLVVVVEGGMSSEGSVVASYDASCSSSDLTERVIIETRSSVDECRVGRPSIVEEREESENGGRGRACL